MSQPVPLGLVPSFGFGDRLGVATPGHVAALRRVGDGIAPIFAQQSIREMTRTERSPKQVMDDALRGATEAGYDGPQGADADHLKTTRDVDRTAEVGFCFFTIDPSDFVDGQADSYEEDELAAKAKAVADQTQWIDEYRGKSLKLPSGKVIHIDEPAATRAAVKYGRAVNHAIMLAKHIADVSDKAGRDYEIELSVDETPQPTTLAEHFIIADRCLKQGMKLVSLAPRFIGAFEKGVDYKGDAGNFERSVADHAAVAKMLGPYKLSLHSGSDKLSIYPAFARATRGLWHVKTAGTSYLEALRVVLRHDLELFRWIVEFAREHYETDKATYHVSATLHNTPRPAGMSALDLERTYLGRWEDIPDLSGLTAPGRQILHTTFGSVLTSGALQPKIMDILNAHPDTYRDVLDEHFSHHLTALRMGM
jgi:hypothetical protein